MDIYAIGREIGELGHRITRVERRLDAWKRLWGRIGLLLVLWTAVLLAGTSADTISTVLASLIKKLIS